MKAILVIDEMPKSCKECQFCGRVGRNLEKYVCMLTREYSEDIHLVGCPLKPLPEKRELHQYVGDRCYHCRFFNGEKSSVGIACTNPMKEWRTRTAKYKQPSMKACKMFERKQGE